MIVSKPPAGVNVAVTAGMTRSSSDSRPMKWIAL